MDLDYPDHHFTAMTEFRRITRNPVSQIKYRQRQLQSAGYKKLLQDLITKTDRKTLLESFFLVRLPIEATDKIRKGHPIKRVPQAGCAKKMLSSALFREAWSRWAKEASRAEVPHIHIWAYPPDMSFVFTTSIPFDEEGRYDTEQVPASDFISYPELV